MTLEICIDSIEAAIAAQAGGADRLELCGNLLEGGTTPTKSMVELCRQYSDLPIMMMVRPRGGDFLYSDYEFELMQKDIQLAKEMGVKGVVLGLLLEDGNIDVYRTRQLVELARPLEVTFHRAFDRVRNPYLALRELINLKVDRILTSGLKPTVPEGISLIKELIQQAGDELIIMPGSGVNETNVADIIAQTGAREVHSSAKHQISSQMLYANPDVYMGAEGVDEYQRNTVSEARVRAMREAMAW